MDVNEWKAESERRTEAARAVAVNGLAIVDLRDAPAAVLAEIRQASDPDLRTARLREAQRLRRDAARRESLAELLDRDGKADRADAARTQAQAMRAEADTLEARLRAA